MTVFYLVFYATDGTIHLLPKQSKEECQQSLQKMFKDKRICDRYKNSMIIKRNLDAYDQGYVFGHMDTPLPETQTEKEN